MAGVINNLEGLQTKKFKPLLMAGLCGLTAVMNCGEPAEWLEPQWGLVAEFPEEYASTVRAMAVSDGVIYFVASSRNNAIIKYESSRFSEALIVAERVFITDVKFSGLKGFGCGGSTSAQGTRPFLASFDGEKWKEEEINAPGVRSLITILGVEGDRCWLLYDLKGKGTRVGMWDGVSLETYEPSGPAEYAARAADTGYIYSWRGNLIRLSADAGNTWVTEEAVIKQQGLDLESVHSGAAIGKELFIISQLSFNGKPYDGVLRRTGPPGAGEYDVAFMSYHGPYFYNLADIDFRNAGDGLAVGSHTTLHYWEGGWLLETTRELDFICVAADAKGGYWAVADNHSRGGANTFLLYQP
jgi:hypothetical protein